MSDFDSNSACHDEDEDNSLIEGLTPEQLRELSIKIYDLLMGELRIEQERHGLAGYGRRF